MSSDSKQPAESRDPTTQPSNEFHPAHPGGGLWSASFLGLLVTQFLVALNDNMFRWLLIPIGKRVVERYEVIPPGFAQPIGQDFVLAAGSACFLLPFVILAAPAGYAADRFSKRSVMIGCKVAEIVVMILGILVILTGDLYIMLAVLFLMGAQSAIFSPAKYSSIPEIVRTDRISAANGVIGMTTMAAIILGTVAGGYLYKWTTPPDHVGNAAAALLPGQYHWWIPAAALIGVAVLGWIASLFIGPLEPANPGRRFPLNPVGQTVSDLSTLFSKHALGLAALGSACFWGLGALAQLNIDKFAQFELLVHQEYVGPLLGVLTLGIGGGAFLAGIWSSGKIELGIVPLGAAGMSLAAMLMMAVPQGDGVPWSTPYTSTALLLLALGIAAGLYDIPLMAFLQERSPKESRGRILAANNFLAFSAMFLASGIFWLLGAKLGLGLSARQIWLFVGIVMIPVSLLACYFVFTNLLHVLLRPLVWIFYRIRVAGLEHLPEEGGALLVANHVTWIDAVLLFLRCPRSIRFVAYADYTEGPIFGRLARDLEAIPIGPDRKSMIRSIRTTREALKQGDLVCIFPEGALSRSGKIEEFHPGFLSMLKGTDVPVIPIRLSGLWGSIFSFERGKFFWKWPRQIPYPVSIVYGRPILDPGDPEQVRLVVQQLATQTDPAGENTEPEDPEHLSPTGGGSFSAPE